MVKSLILITIASVSLSGCGDGQPKTLKKGQSPDTAPVAATHKPAQCPALSGTYGPNDGTNMESIEITPVMNGMNVKLLSGPDTFESVIDGTARIFTEPVFYLGQCENNEVFVQFYDASKKLYANARYALNDKDELVITQNNFDPMVEDNGFPPGERIWIKKPATPKTDTESQQKLN